MTQDRVRQPESGRRAGSPAIADSPDAIDQYFAHADIADFAPQMNAGGAFGSDMAVDSSGVNLSPTPSS